MNNVQISVIITTYNQENYISEAIESVLNQKDCPNIEIIIGNDCSTDGTWALINFYQRLYPNIIKIVSYEKNQGMLSNLKNCFNSCKGTFIAICEGDDYWIDPFKLKKQYDVMMQHKDCYLCFNDIYTKHGDVLNEHIPQIKEKLGSFITLRDLIFTGNCIGNFSCCMYRKEVLNLIPEDYWLDKINADFCFNSIVIHKSNYAIFLHEKLSVYRIVSDSITHKDKTFRSVLNNIIALSNVNMYTKRQCEEILFEKMRITIIENYGLIVK